MRDLFPGHYRMSDEKIKDLWENATFIFDSNVLLNLYSYPEQARNEFFSVLEEIKKDIWIPYQVAYEFHKNRFNKIRASNDSVEKLRTKLKRANSDLSDDFEKIEFSKRNTGIVDLNEIINTARNAYEKLEKAIDLACSRLPSVSLDDPIGKEIADLFDGKVGARPRTQEELDSYIADGEKRYNNEIPPGFMDKAKGESYIDGDIIYSAKFGDLIIWRQTISHIKETGKKNVIFITGDRKEDWWWSEKGQIIGPHPRLISEFITKSDAENFWIYTSDKFLEYANTFLKGIKVSIDSIEQVKHASDHQQSFDDAHGRIVTKQGIIQRAIERATKGIIDDDFESENFDELSKYKTSAIEIWLQDLHPDRVIVQADDVDFLVVNNLGEAEAYEIMRGSSLSTRAICLKIMGLSEISESKKTLIVIIEPNQIKNIRKIIADDGKIIQRTIIMSGVDKIIFGYVLENSFIPTKEFTNL